MPVQRCVLNNKPGFKWGQQGKCFTYDINNASDRESAREEAATQGRAIKAAGGE